MSLHSRTTPNRLAVAAGSNVWSWSDLGHRVRFSAAELVRLRVEAGDHIGVLMINGPEFVVVVHALMRLGAVLVPLNTRLTSAELAWQVRDAGIHLLLHDAANTGRAAEVGEATDVRRRGIGEVLAGFGGEGFRGDPLDGGGRRSASPLRWEGAAGGLKPGPAGGTSSLDLSAAHAIVYTSGTTGRPKGALLTYGNHWYSAIGSAINLGSHRDDRWLAVLPLFHVGGLAILMRSAIFGTPVEIHPRFDPAAANAAIDRGATLVSIVSAMLRRMLDERDGRPYPPSLRAILLGGGPAPRPLLEECARLGVAVVQTYGMTETASQAVTLAPEDALRKLGSAGKPLLPTELRIEGRDGDAAPGEPGELLLRGPNVSPGYLNHPPKTGRTPDGWLRTGDEGYLDGEGYLYVLDRRDDLIISGGENVYPAEVESVLLEHPAVLEAAVVTAPDERWGAVPVAFVALRAGAQASADDLRAHCAERLARYKVPAAVRSIPQLPRTASGKLLRRNLRWELE